VVLRLARLVLIVVAITSVLLTRAVVGISALRRRMFVVIRARRQGCFEGKLGMGRRLVVDFRREQEKNYKI
jgi:hypothetical protein